MIDLQRVWLVAKREITTRFKQRSYRWTFFLQMLFAVVAGLAPIGIAYFTDVDGPERVVVYDATNGAAVDRLSALLNNDGTGLPDLEVRSDVASADEVREQVADGDAAVGVVITVTDGESPNVELLTGGDAAISPTAMRVQSAAMQYSIELSAQSEGLSGDEAQALLQQPSVTVHNPQGEEGVVSNSPFANTNSAEYGIAYVLLFVSYMAIIMFGTWIAQGVVEEKASRIMEIMVNAATPRDLLFGKVLGILLAGLCLLIPMLLISGTLLALQPDIADALGVSLTQSFQIDLGAISVKAIATFLFYFIFGFMLYGGLYAGIGSMVSRQEEVNQAVTPVMTLVIFGFFGAFVTLMAPNTIIAKVLMYLPLTSPFSAVPRVLLGSPSKSEVIMSAVLLVVAAVAAMWGAAKLYRVGVLMYGQKPGLKSLFRLNRMQTVAR